MFPLRRAALRLLSSPSVTTISRPRSITSFASITSRVKPAHTTLPFQRRWATSEAEAKKEEVPISELQPTPQEETENAISESNAAGEQTAATRVADAPASTTKADFLSAESTASEDVAAAGNTAPVDAAPESSPPVEAVDKSAPGTPKPTIHVGNLFFDVTENDLKKEFSRFGEIQNTRLIRDARGLSKGFAYITFKSTEEAQAAVDDLNNQLFEGRRLFVAFAHQNERAPSEFRERRNQIQNPPSKTLFIGNMSFEMTDRDLNDLFRGIKNVIDVRVAIDRRTGQPRGFAHADFVDVKSAMEGMRILEGKETYGRKLRLDYSFGPSTAPKNTPR